MSTLSKLRPWLTALLAALLGLLITGLGHLYLRRWRRALLWIVLAFTVAFVFVPTSALEAVANGTTMPPLADLMPVLAVSLVSVADAFFLGWKKVARTQSVAHESDEQHRTCPQCGGEIDPELDFCHWCTTRLDTDDGVSS
ncbi:zinc ribbon domain-containing protein [Haloferax sp. DFSO60]|uniref:DUF7575 domain-containing protein n=1 Tax=Haloferax sp. DFSO60 TaxID=3388652 RepID=UPI003979173E